LIAGRKHLKSDLRLPGGSRLGFPLPVACLRLLFVLLVAQPALAQVALLERTNLQGSKRRLRHTDPDLSDSDFRNGAKLMIVVGGTWKLCSEPGYNGDCSEVPLGVDETVRDFCVAAVRR
jgi:hypothetical protein